MIKFIPLHKNIIKEYYGTIELDNSATADYLKYEKLSVKLDREDVIVFDVEDDYNPIYVRKSDLIYEDYYGGAVIYNTESHSIEFFNKNRFSILEDILFKYAEMIELCDFELIVEG